jgi:hypothetical protein
VIARIQDDAVVLDPRTVQPNEDEALLQRLAYPPPVPPRPGTDASLRSA